MLKHVVRGTESVVTFFGRAVLFYMAVMAVLSLIVFLFILFGFIVAGSALMIAKVNPNAIVKPKQQAAKHIDSEQAR